MIHTVENPHQVKAADIVVGIPSYQEAASIALPVAAAGKGLARYFGDFSSVIINVDNCSPDGTKEVFLTTPTQVPKIYVSTTEGVTGKGENIHNLFQIATELGTKVILIFDADLTSITPTWIQHLLEPLLDGYDFVVPIYSRHKYDGTITKNIAYPMVRTLYGLRVRQPMAGDFGISAKLARCFLVEKTWTEDVLNFGIDIWMTTVAICRHFNVCQTFMGASKSHRHKDPSTDLTAMFSQVISTVFQLMTDFEFLWKDIPKSRPSIIYGFGLGYKQQPPEVTVSRERLFRSFRSGFERYGEIWPRLLSPENWRAVQELAKLDQEEFQYSSALWARILFDFAVAYRKSPLPREKILSALIPFYHSITLSFVNASLEMDLEEAEIHLEKISRIFELEKGYLIERWDDSVPIGHINQGKSEG